MTSSFTNACHRPFANGTEGDAWMDKWCTYCARDHGLHHGRLGEPMCRLMTSCMFGEEWPEGWIPEPDDGRFFLPSRLVCTAFTPCEDCGGDPGAEARAERVAEVTAYWKART
jgi:hypothetical protein